ncbi:hypothetical protein CMQ_7766 [Grosmannia clavigera kw1407]|uniref:Uncharacterized protein n=1 Tax=Grosmannia clavigera (strain kw1407 / UAMH 11150) TaxID=655863 RepID=F0XS33_GROCL|nr:uncharacterized protein CMQ_7766 [Grosmannia clavigera kw1407]EFW99398.1 hypothetical protein CMQ_7766 [Grosmannia clavigera kw1407]
MTRQDDIETLAESFYTLADEVQSLIDRKTILEHKLRFATEQYQYLADKYAPAGPEISETLAQLQLPPDLHQPVTIHGAYVPLPKRGQAGCNQHQLALLIRDGRRAAQELAARNVVQDNISSKASTSPPSTVMEQDFTVEGKKGMLQCPFSAVKSEQQSQQQKEEPQHEGEEQKPPNLQQNVSPTGSDKPGGADAAEVTVTAENRSDPTPHDSADPICATMLEEAKSQTAPSSAGAVKCPIRFMDQHSPEEIAHYVETHKHELPRSHAICVRRYNKNEEQIRKLDAKYGSLVSMISGLGHLHQPMLPLPEGGGPEDQAERAELHRSSNERVEDWAKAVSVGAVDGRPGNMNGEDDESYERRSRSRTRAGSLGDCHINAVAGVDEIDGDRQSHFNRPLKEVRLGESPSRPWGIAVPLSSLPNANTEPPLSPPAAPVRMPSPRLGARRPVPLDASSPPKARKCPFDHTKLAAAGAPAFPSPHGHENGPEAGPRQEEPEKGFVLPVVAETESPTTPVKPRMPQAAYMPQTMHTAQMPSSTSYQPAPAFVNFTPPTTATKGDSTAPQMLFTGPVFIGYSMEQAVQFMQHFQNMQK